MNPRTELWIAYLQRLTGTLSNREVARLVDSDEGSVSRWRSGKSTPDADTIVRVARRLGESAVHALVATGYLTADDLSAYRPPRAFGLDEFTDLEIAQEIVRRIEAGETVSEAVANIEDARERRISTTRKYAAENRYEMDPEFEGDADDEDGDGL